MHLFMVAFCAHASCRSFVALWRCAARTCAPIANLGTRAKHPGHRHRTRPPTHTKSCSAWSFRSGDSWQRMLGHFTGAHAHTLRCTASAPTFPLQLHPSLFPRSASKRASILCQLPSDLRPRCSSSRRRSWAGMAAAGASLGRFAVGASVSSAQLETSILKPSPLGACLHRRDRLWIMFLAKRFATKLERPGTGCRQVGQLFFPRRALT
ncbi:hypothetical protein T484DRAFT_1944632 [Baffinella frigidus]|nr:hypothetical protein T484DRAFT_1944632 [Cryptophyta sp. CCMP2293]